MENAYMSRPGGCHTTKRFLEVLSLCMYYTKSAASSVSDGGAFILPPFPRSQNLRRLALRNMHMYMGHRQKGCSLLLCSYAVTPDLILV